jgi:hypothetical protein
MASSEWDVDLETARTVDSRLREVYDADIDADDVHTTGNAMAPAAAVRRCLRFRCNPGQPLRVQLSG